MANRNQKLPRWNGDSWNGLLPPEWAEEFGCNPASQPALPTAEKAEQVLEGDLFTENERRNLRLLRVIGLTGEGALSLQLGTARRMLYDAHVAAKGLTTEGPVNDAAFELYQRYRDAQNF